MFQERRTRLVRKAPSSSTGKKKAPAPRRGRPAPAEEASEASREREGDPEEDASGDEAVDEAGGALDDDAVVGEIAAELGDDDAVTLEPAPAPASRDRALSRFDPFSAYLAEVQRHSLLTPEEEHRLAVSYHEAQDVQAAARLVTANLRLVVKIAYEYRRAYRNLMDLIQEGNIGLMQAVKRYDPYRGVKLSSYAAWWIRAYILRFILNNWRLVKLGTTQTQRKLFFNLNKEKQRLLSMGVDPTAAELAQRLDVPESEVTDMDRRLSGGDLSLDAPVGDSDGRPMSRVDLLPMAGALADDTLADEELNELVRGRLAKFGETLTGKDAIIFKERLVAEEPVTLQDIGERFGISRERVRQVEKRLQDRLRAYLKGELGDAIQFR
ncbi:MAG: RNA polymerase factor sigma-32 [Deltaproteobacteria bacterium]|nr:RNA polymerase factor sigma-32 [Deltaproteobacteria bacterium]